MTLIFIGLQNAIYYPMKCTVRAKDGSNCVLYSIDHCNIICAVTETSIYNNITKRNIGRFKQKHSRKYNMREQETHWRACARIRYEENATKMTNGVQTSISQLTKNSKRQQRTDGNTIEWNGMLFMSADNDNN